MAATAASATAVGGTSGTGGTAATDGGANAGETACAASSAIRSTSVGAFFLPNEISFFQTETFCFGSAASHSTFCLRPNEISFFHFDVG